MTDRTSPLTAATAATAAIAGLFGVVVGAVVSGHYQLESQRIAFQESENAAQYETSRAAAQSLGKTAAGYLTELFHLGVLARTPAKIPDGGERMRALYSSAFELSLQTTLPTAQKIFEANVHVSELLAAAGDPDKLKALEPQDKVLGEVFVLLYSDMARFRFTSGPTTGRDELLTSVLQMLAQGSTKTQ